MSRPDTWWMYVVVTANGLYYTGVTLDVTRRVAQHNAGRGAKFLRGERLPCQLVKAWCFDKGDDATRKSLAHSAETRFKQLRRTEKEEYLFDDKPLPLPGWSFAVQEMTRHEQ